MWRDQHGRPFTDGCVDGPSAVFGSHSVPVDWLVDSGAGIAAIRDSVGANFSWTVKIGVTAGPQGAWSVTEDLEIAFDDDNGQCRMPAQTRIAVKPDDDDETSSAHAKWPTSDWRSPSEADHSPRRCDEDPDALSVSAGATISSSTTDIVGTSYANQFSAEPTGIGERR